MMKDESLAIPGFCMPGIPGSGKSSVFEPEANFDRKKICRRDTLVGLHPTILNFNPAQELYFSAKLHFLSSGIVALTQ